MDPITSYVVAIIGAIAGAVSILQATLKKRKVSKKGEEADKILHGNIEDNRPVFLPVMRGDYNSKFYEMFHNVIGNAEEEIFITGRGLPMGDDVNDEDSEAALRYINFYRETLDRKSKLKVVRLQYGDDLDENWKNELIKLKHEFPDRFFPYILGGDESNHDMVHVAAIDPCKKDKCIAEVMIPSEKVAIDRRGSRKRQHMAGSAVFLKGHQDVCKSIRDRILELIDGAEELVSPS